MHGEKISKDLLQHFNSLHENEISENAILFLDEYYIL
jgi:hypothetical protein